MTFQCIWFDSTKFRAITTQPNRWTQKKSELNKKTDKQVLVKHPPNSFLSADPTWSLDLYTFMLYSVRLMCAGATFFRLTFRMEPWIQAFLSSHRHSLSIWYLFNLACDVNVCMALNHFCIVSVEISSFDEPTQMTFWLILSTLLPMKKLNTQFCWPLLLQRTEYEWT